MVNTLVKTLFRLFGRMIQVMVLTFAFVASAYFLYQSGLQFIPFRYTGF